MRIPLVIGDKEYKTKKSALEHYSKILNSYDFGDSLNDQHYDDLIDLINHYVDYIINKEPTQNSDQASEVETTQAESDKSEIYVADIRIAKFQFNTKCFEVVYSNDDTWIISYRVFINKTKTSPRSLFIKVCRNTIQSDLIKIKQDYFSKYSNKSKAPCQESKEFFRYEDLVVDHRQPNTLSVIIDRFIEVFEIDVDIIDYKASPDQLTLFKDESLSNKFREYHKDKALLRIVEKSLNLSRTGMARLKEMKDDIKIDN